MPLRQLAAAADHWDINFYMLTNLALKRPGGLDCSMASVAHTACLLYDGSSLKGQPPEVASVLKACDQHKSQEQSIQAAGCSWL